MQQFEDLTIEVGADGVATLTLNRPDRLNAVSPRMHQELVAVWPALERTPGVRSVVLTGAGRGFCAGGDMDMSQAAVDDPGYREQVVAEARAIVRAMVEFPIPVVAAVNGPAVGLGFSLALFSDVVLVADTAHVSDPHVSVGLVAADGGVLAWPLMTSLLTAKEYLLTGRRIPAARAVELGLANRVVPAAELLAEAHALAAEIAAQPRQAVRDTKRALNIHLGNAVAAVMDFAFAAESHSFSEPDVAATIARFAEKAGRSR
ncbi:enoyl-CoA hydratase [Pseudonocardia thermophila]|uniref:Enoyl-CoA hydratase n=1 Tax=Pseudonocardia thermophila TaxID=1848 RepID=A0A1M6P5E0_PSETH|nr:enoyl-CoA hydratase/isomerase family protein [Pseudonocardia thermophila]SHK03175.1 enoyl-CoA hydratase [Pseudonocardia thermophila]